MKHYRIYFILSCIYLGIASFLFCTPGDAFPEGLDEVLSYDKLLHALAFTLLAGSFTFSSYKQKGRNVQLFLFWSMAALSYGVLIEILQFYFIKNRSGDIPDLVADITGCALSFVIALVFLRRKVN
jgi:VanZ family protein